MADDVVEGVQCLDDRLVVSLVLPDVFLDGVLDVVLISDEFDRRPSIHVVDEAHPIFLVVEASHELATASHVDVDKLSDLGGSWDGRHRPAYRLGSFPDGACFAGLLGYCEAFDIDAGARLGSLDDSLHTRVTESSMLGLDVWSGPVELVNKLWASFCVANSSWRDLGVAADDVWGRYVLFFHRGGVEDSHRTLDDLLDVE